MTNRVRATIRRRSNLWRRNLYWDYPGARRDLGLEEGQTDRPQGGSDRGGVLRWCGRLLRWLVEPSPVKFNAFLVCLGLPCGQ
jgi:hypothetical protein